MNNTLKKTVVMGGIVLIASTTSSQQINTIECMQPNVDIVIRPGEYPNKPGKRLDGISKDFDINCPIRFENGKYCIQEYDINYLISKKVVDYLQSQGIKAVLLETNNKSEDLNNAGRRAKQYNAPIYLSIHNNSYNDKSEGYFAMTNPNDNMSEKFAKDVTKAMTSNPMLIPKKENRINTGYIGEMNVKPGSKINCLLEMSFALSNPKEAQKVVNEQQLKFYAKTIGDELIKVLKEMR